MTRKRNRRLPKSGMGGVTGSIFPQGSPELKAATAAAKVNVEKRTAQIKVGSLVTMPGEGGVGRVTLITDDGRAYVDFGGWGTDFQLTSLVVVEA